MMNTLKIRWIFLLAALVALSFTYGCNDAAEDEGTVMEDEGMEEMGEMEETDEPVMDVQQFANVDDNARNNVQQVVDPYLELKNALVNTDAAAAQSQAQNMQQQMRDMPVENMPGDQQTFWNERVKAIEQHTGNIANSTDVEEQRKAFYPLSEKVYQLSKAFGTGQELYVQYCPMAFDNEGAWWISSEREIKNPYFGDKMMKCGRVQERLAQNR